MNENILAWNVTNWVTVILMVTIGFFIIGVLAKWRQSKKVSSINTTTGVVSGASIP